MALKTQSKYKTVAHLRSILPVIHIHRFLFGFLLGFNIPFIELAYICIFQLFISLSHVVVNLCLLSALLRHLRNRVIEILFSTSKVNFE